MPLEKQARETIFLEHYEWLLQRSRQFACGSRDDAKDIVQDLFVSFMKMQDFPLFKNADHVRAYLNKALRNRWITRKGRTSRDAATRLADIDFDTIEAVMERPNRNHLFLVREDLALICEYILMRRLSNKCATAFALEFFFGIPRPELCSLLKMSRQNLSSQVELGRLEAIAYIERPHVLSFLWRHAVAIPDFPLTLPEDSNELFAEMQRRILSCPVGSHDILRSLDGRHPECSLTLKQTAHLGSCRRCLKYVSTSLTPAMKAPLDRSDGQ